MSLDERAAPFYDQFPLRFPYREVQPHGVSEEAYENIRRGYSAVMAGISLGAWYRSGCMPLFFFISIIGIPFFRLLVLLGRQADEQTQRIVRLTRALMWLTVALLVATLVLAGIAWHTDERIRQINEITKSLPAPTTP